MICVASDAAVIDSSLGTMTFQTRLDRWKVEIAGEFTRRDVMAIEARHAFPVQVVIELAEYHPTVGSFHPFDLGSRVITLGFRHVMASGTTDRKSVV